MLRHTLLWTSIKQMKLWWTEIDEGKSWSQIRPTLGYKATAREKVEYIFRPDLGTDLEVIFDLKLSLSFHIDAIVSSSYKILDFVIGNMKDFTTCKLFFNRLVRAKLAAIVWIPIYNIYTHR